MTYNITSTSGSAQYTVTNGTTNTQTNLGFVGKGTLNYGTVLNTNFLKLLENSAWNVAPDKPIAGQLWWDTGSNILKVYNGTSFSIVSPSLERISSSNIGNLAIASGNITGEITNGNVTISPNTSGTGSTVINRLTILGTAAGKVPYTAANGMIVTGSLSYNSTDGTLTSGNVSATYLAGTLTTGPQSAITSVGTLDSINVTGNIGIGTTSPAGNIQIQSANESPIIRLTNTSSAFTTTPDFNNEIPLGNGYGPGFGIGGSLLVFERTSTFSRNSNPIGGIYWKNTLTNSYVISGSITAISSNQSAGSMRLFYKAGGQHRFETYPVNADGSYNISGSTTQFSITPSGSVFLGNLSIGTSGNATNGSMLQVAGNVVGYFEGPIGANTANSGAFTTVTTTGNITTTTSGYLGRIGINTATPKGLLQANAAGGAIYLTNTGLNTIDRFNINIEKTDPTQTRLGFVDFMGGLVWNRTLTDNTIAQASIIVTANNYAASPTLNTYYITLNNHIFQTSTDPVNKDATPPTRMSISNNGNVYIGNSSNSGNLYVYGSVNGYHEGAIGANTANSGAFTTVTTTGNINANGSIIANGSVTASTPFFENSTTVTADYTIATGKNAGTFGPVTINSGVTVTIPSGSVWSVV